VIKDVDGFGCGRHGDAVVNMQSDARMRAADGR
jgi:hypothetical protein